MLLLCHSLGRMPLRPNPQGSCQPAEHHNLYRRRDTGNTVQRIYPPGIRVYGLLLGDDLAGGVLEPVHDFGGRVHERLRGDLR